MRMRVVISLIGVLGLLLGLIGFLGRRPAVKDTRKDSTQVVPGTLEEYESRPGSDGVRAGVPRIGRNRNPRAGEAPGESRSGASGNWLDQLFSDEGATVLPREALDRWLESGRTNAADLLAARQAGGGVEFLKMALEKYPNDPRVLMAAIVLDDGPDAQRERLERLKSAAPDNALADYLSAANEFKGGNQEKAVADLLAASGKKKFDDYTLDAMLSTEELYLQAGRTPAEAKALGTSTTLLPHLSELKKLAQNVAELQGQYLAAGDPASAERLAQAGMQLGEQLANGPGSRTLIGELVGIAVQKIVLKPLDSQASYEFVPGSGTPTSYVESLEARRAASRENSAVFESWIRGATEGEIVSYFDRLKLYGETEALNWIRERSPKP